MTVETLGCAATQASASVAVVTPSRSAILVSFLTFSISACELSRGQDTTTRLALRRLELLARVGEKIGIRSEATVVGDLIA